MNLSCRLRIPLQSQGSQEDRKAVLQDLQSELKGKTIIDVTTAAYLKEESKWGQTSTVLMHQEALAAPAKWVRCWNTVFVVGRAKHVLRNVGFCHRSLVLDDIVHCRVC